MNQVHSVRTLNVGFFNNIAGGSGGAAYYSSDCTETCPDINSFVKRWCTDYPIELGNVNASSNSAKNGKGGAFFVQYKGQDGNTCFFFCFQYKRSVLG